MSILPVIFFVLAFLVFIGLGVFMVCSEKARTTKNSLFENIEEKNPDAHEEYCDAYSIGVFVW